MAEPTILMCPPEHFGIEYEINPWMSRSRQSDQVVASRQWESLCTLLRRAGARIELIDPVAGLPDLVFTANAGLIHRGSVILSQFRHEVRQREMPHFKAWFEQRGLTIRELNEDFHFEGAGDALFCGDTLVAGYRIRSDARAHQQIGQRLGCPVVPLELIDPYYYHLDTCFCPLAPAQAIYFPDALDDYGQRALASVVEDLIPVQPDEARRFACNAVVIGRSVITNTGCPGLHRDLRARGYETFETPLDEFVKAGGSAKCLTLRIDGEEAAAWKANASPSEELGD